MGRHVRDQHGVWERITASFDRSRQRRWSHVEAFLAGLPPRSRVLDLMAGNGRHTAAVLDARHEAWWCDWNRPMARVAAARFPDAAVVVADATRLPFANSSFDACIYVAGLHGIPSPGKRLDSLRGMLRVLRPDGPAQITVWSRASPRFRDMGDPDRPLDVQIPWRAHGHDEARSYHLYTPDALRDDLEAAGLAVERLEERAVVGREPDNLVAWVRHPL